MAWAYFQNQAAWDNYHNAVCADEGIPRPGYRASDGAPMLLNAWTDAHANPVQVKGTGNVTAWVAHVPDGDIAKYGLGLNVADSAVTFNPDGTVTFVFQGRTYTSVLDVGFNWRKPKPPTWTDPHTGTTYDTATGQPV